MLIPGASRSLYRGCWRETAQAPSFAWIPARGWSVHWKRRPQDSFAAHVSRGSQDVSSSVHWEGGTRHSCAPCFAWIPLSSFASARPVGRSGPDRPCFSPANFGGARVRLRASSRRRYMSCDSCSQPSMAEQHARNIARGRHRRDDLTIQNGCAIMKE